MDLPSSFESYLRNSSLSGKTIRNYLSDLSHFSTWTKTLIGTDNFVPYLTPVIIEKYKSSMEADSVPARTINRRLSTLRLLGKYLHDKGFLSTNPTLEITNVSIDEAQKHEQLLEDFKKYLVEERVSEKTMRNYISDVRSFLRFAGQAD